MALVSVRDIHKTYGKGGAEVEVLRGITLDVEAGTFVALQGTSGSGKSTLLHIIGLLDSPTSGSYLFNGEDVSKLTDDERSDLRNQVSGFVFQSFHLVPYATALENVMLPGLYGSRPQHEIRERAMDLLDQVGLADRVHFKPSELSGGTATARRPCAVSGQRPGPRACGRTHRTAGQLRPARKFSPCSGQSTPWARPSSWSRTIPTIAAYAERRIFLKDGLVADDG